VTAIVKPPAGGSPAAPPTPAPPPAPVPVVPSTVASTQKTPAAFRPYAPKGPTQTATVGLNPDPPAVASSSAPDDAAIPLTGTGAQGFAPFSQVY
jgi:hypothetical protein